MAGSVVTMPQDLASRDAHAIGRLRLHYRALGSTNELARHLIRAAYPAGTVVVADYQSAGRGRQGRRWEAPAGAALLCSIIVRPVVAPTALRALGMAAALATAEAIEAVAEVAVALKWPNDLLVGRPLRKVAGILVETELSGAEVEGAVIGIGVNVAASPPDVPTATHLTAVAGRLVARAALLDALLTRLGAWLALLPPGATAAPPALVEAWRAGLITLGQPVRVAAIDQTYAAVAEDVDADGALLVRLADGQMRRVVAADVSLTHALAGDCP